MNEEDARRYLEQAAREPELDREAETELARAASAGDADARERLIRGNMRLVPPMAERYRNRGLPFPSLLAQGHVGLRRAASRFDGSEGPPFARFADWWIRQAIARAIAGIPFET